MMTEETPMMRISAKLAKAAKKAAAAAPRTAAPSPAPSDKPVAAPAAPPAPERARPTEVRRKRTVAAKPPGRAAAPRVDPAALLKAVAPGFEALARELRDLKRLVQPPGARSRNTTAAGDAALEASVDSLRRLLSEAIEQRMESVVRELVEVHRELSAPDAARAGERLGQLLDTLGALRFAAEPMDVVDPLIHTVVGERRDDSAPDGVVLETARPGYRTARGAVVSKAAVVVNRRS
jgi:molecular chaperone GrpE (heat shock protein)